MKSEFSEKLKFLNANFYLSENYHFHLWKKSSFSHILNLMKFMTKGKKKSLSDLVKNIQVQHFNGTSLVTLPQDIWDSRKWCFSEEGRKAETDDL